MGRIIKNIGHKKGMAGRQIFKAYDIAWDGNTSVRIVARSRDEAERIALDIAKRAAQKILEGMVKEEFKKATY